MSEPNKNQVCQSCETVGINIPATTKRNGENVCDECAAEVDSRKAEQKEVRETLYDERGIRISAQVEGLATARPWHLEIEDGFLFIEDAEYRALATAESLLDGESNEMRIAEQRANAALIVTAVNEYDSTKAKVEKLEAALRRISYKYGHTFDEADEIAVDAALEGV